MNPLTDTEFRLSSDSVNGRRQVRAVPARATGEDLRLRWNSRGSSRHGGQWGCWKDGSRSRL